MAEATTHFIENPHALTPDEVCARLGVDPSLGLSTDEARERLATTGPNVLATAPPVPAWRRFLAQFLNGLVLLLLAAGVISLAVWAIEGGGVKAGHGLPYEALTIFAIVLVNALIGFVQEERAEGAIASLKRLSAATAMTMRDGQRVAVPAAELVPGDVIVVEEGATIPADARVVESVSLSTSEAALTGESMPVTKVIAPIAEDSALGDRTNMLFSGTAAVFGHGRAVVVATGMRAEVGRIAGLLASTEAEATPLQKQLDLVGKVLGAAVIAIAIVVGATILGMQHEFSTAVLVGVLLYTVSLAVSAVPEGLSAVTTVVLSLGMQRMAKRNAIVRKLVAVETLGSANVIASDKTGTLTKNEMTVRVALTASGRTELTGTGYLPEGEARVNGAALAEGRQHLEVRRALAAASLASNALLVQREGRWSVIGDPTEGALKVAALKLELTEARLAQRFARVAEIPFSSERKMMSVVHTDARRDGERVLFTKGAPDVLLMRCNRERVGEEERPIDDARRAAITASIDALAGEALRLLGLAYRRIPASQALDERAEEELIWLGVVGMIDPPRPEAKTAVLTAQQAGVRVIMITGDHPAAARAIGAELGIAAATARVLAGAELSRMSEAELRAVVPEVSIYARVSPEHKLAIVRALKSHGAIVAMTGDGVNDAPALKAADIGIAMGITGTDVSKEAADMVLADDNFATIVAAIEEGRSIYANIRKFLRYMLATNLGEVFVMFFGVVFAAPLGLTTMPGEAVILPLLATMILWINLVTDSGPALAVGVDPADPGLMRQPPRAAAEGVITRAMWRTIALVSTVTAIATLAMLDVGTPGGWFAGSGDTAYARTLAFHTLVLAQLLGIFSLRSERASLMRDLFANGWLWIAIAIGFGMQWLVLELPPMQKAFGTVSLGVRDWLSCLGAAATVPAANELRKLVAAIRARARG